MLALSLLSLAAACVGLCARAAECAGLTAPPAAQFSLGVSLDAAGESAREARPADWRAYAERKAALAEAHARYGAALAAAAHARRLLSAAERPYLSAVAREEPHGARSLLKEDYLAAMGAAGSAEEEQRASLAAFRHALKDFQGACSTWAAAKLDVRTAEWRRSDPAAVSERLLSAKDAAHAAARDAGRQLEAARASLSQLKARHADALSAFQQCVVEVRSRGASFDADEWAQRFAVLSGELGAVAAEMAHALTLRSDWEVADKRAAAAFNAASAALKAMRLEKGDSKPSAPSRPVMASSLQGNASAAEIGPTGTASPASGARTSPCASPGSGPSSPRAQAESPFSSTDSLGLALSPADDAVRLSSGEASPGASLSPARRDSTEGCAREHSARTMLSLHRQLGRITSACSGSGRADNLTSKGWAKEKGGKKSRKGSEERADREISSGSDSDAGFNPPLLAASRPVAIAPKCAFGHTQAQSAPDVSYFPQAMEKRLSPPDRAAMRTVFSAYPSEEDLGQTSLPHSPRSRTGASSSASSREDTPPLIGSPPSADGHSRHAQMLRSLHLLPRISKQKTNTTGHASERPEAPGMSALESHLSGMLTQSDRRHALSPFGSQEDIGVRSSTGTASDSESDTTRVLHSFSLSSVGSMEDLGTGDAFGAGPIPAPKNYTSGGRLQKYLPRMFFKSSGTQRELAKELLSTQAALYGPASQTPAMKGSVIAGPPACRSIEDAVPGDNLRGSGGASLSSQCGVIATRAQESAIVTGPPRSSWTRGLISSSAPPPNASSSSDVNCTKRRSESLSGPAGEGAIVRLKRSAEKNHQGALQSHGRVYKGHDHISQAMHAVVPPQMPPGDRAHLCSRSEGSLPNLAPVLGAVTLPAQANAASKLCDADSDTVIEATLVGEEDGVQTYRINFDYSDSESHAVIEPVLAGTENGLPIYHADFEEDGTVIEPVLVGMENGLPIYQFEVDEDLSDAHSEQLKTTTQTQSLNGLSPTINGSGPDAPHPPSSPSPLHAVFCNALHGSLKQHIILREQAQNVILHHDAEMKQIRAEMLTKAQECNAWDASICDEGVALLQTILKPANAEKATHSFSDPVVASPLQGVENTRASLSSSALTSVLGTQVDNSWKESYKSIQCLTESAALCAKQVVDLQTKLALAVNARETAFVVVAQYDAKVAALSTLSEILSGNAPPTLHGALELAAAAMATQARTLASKELQSRAILLAMAYEERKKATETTEQSLAKVRANMENIIRGAVSGTRQPTEHCAKVWPQISNRLADQYAALKQSRVDLYTLQVETLDAEVAFTDQAARHHAVSHVANASAIERLATFDSMPQ